MTERILLEVSKKLDVLIALTLRQLFGDREFSNKGKRKRGVGEIVRYLNDMEVDTKDIAKITGSTLQSVRTLLTPKRRK